MNILKRVAITESNGLYVLSGHYRKAGDTMYGDDQKHSEETLAKLDNYERIRELGMRYSKAANVPLFDLVNLQGGVPLVESYAKMRKAL